MNFTALHQQIKLQTDAALVTLIDALPNHAPRLKAGASAAHLKAVLFSVYFCENCDMVFERRMDRGCRGN